MRRSGAARPDPSPPSASRRGPHAAPRCLPTADSTNGRQAHRKRTAAAARIAARTKKSRHRARSCSWTSSASSLPGRKQVTRPSLTTTTVAARWRGMRSAARSPHSTLSARLCYAGRPAARPWRAAPRQAAHQTGDAVQEPGTARRSGKEAHRPRHKGRLHAPRQPNPHLARSTESVRPVQIRKGNTVPTCYD